MGAIRIKSIAMPNALIHETSPYLLQHAHNPVNWFPWGEEALQKAAKEDKPILVSIGYSACHWCHVMEHESFEDEKTAAMMNEHFINIKIDREERPDLDHIYMDAVQSLTGSGGWPLNVFLTPDRHPFYGGTYFPPRPVMNRASWTDVLKAVAEAFQNKRSDIEQQAKSITQHLSQANDFGKSAGDHNFNIAQMDIACANLMQQSDQEWGGFGAAPKFPQTFSIQFLLKYFATTPSGQEQDEQRKTALQQACLSLDKMIDGGIYDQLGGGFARYSTDREWLAPHFEKMLYDNALLITVLSEAYQVTGREKYSKVIEETIDFIKRELMHPSSGFYAALDADSEGVEGKFYVWTAQEIQELLGKDAAIFSAYYDVSEEGNWEHTNILRVLRPVEEIAETFQHPVNEINQILDRCRSKLMAVRDKRIRPGLDDKIILSWNALMNTALSKAFQATAEESYKELAIANMAFLLKAFDPDNTGLHHVWKNDSAKHPAFLDDYAYLVQALLQLYRVTADAGYLEAARRYCETTIEAFSEPEGYFYYTAENQQDVIVRKKEVYDGATPSGNAVMARNLLELGIIFNKSEWQQRAYKMVSGLSTVAIKYPTSFGVWLDVLHQFIRGTKEIVLIGDYSNALTELLKKPIPFSIVMAAKQENENYPLLKDKVSSQPLAIFLCENYACRQPVYHIADLLKQIL